MKVRAYRIGEDGGWKPSQEATADIQCFFYLFTHPFIQRCIECLMCARHSPGDISMSLTAPPQKNPHQTPPPQKKNTALMELTFILVVTDSK